MSIMVTRSAMPPMEEYIAEISGLWQSRWLTNMGDKHQALEAALRDFFGAQNTELFTNGHLALELSLQALDLSGEVITTPFTFASTTHAIVRNGLEPVFCDIDPQDYTVDVTKIEHLVTDRTSAIMPVHVYGNVCRVEEIERIARRYGLKVIYDAAHSFGVRYRGKSTAVYGDVACFSFHATKVFHTIEGGAAFFRDEELGRKLYRLKNFGIRDAECVDGVGSNAKMNEFCAAMGLCNLRHVHDDIARRKAVAERYCERLEGVCGVQLNPVQENVMPNYAYFPVVFHEQEFGSTRNEVFDALQRADIYSRKYFYPLTNTFACFHGKYDVEQTPVARHIANRVLTLPIYPELEEAEVDRICDVILSCNS